MAKFDKNYLADLKSRYLDICNLPAEEQAEKFKLRYVLSIGEDVLLIDDRVKMFLEDTSGQEYFEYNDPKLNKYLEKCNIDFESFLVRNQDFNIFSPVENSTRLCFIQFLLHCYKETILHDYYSRWKLSKKGQKVVLKRANHITQAVLSEFLDQPPFGIDTDLDKLTKEERETKVDHNQRVTRLEKIVQTSESKQVRSVKDKQAIQQLAILRQTDIEERITFIRTQINKLARKVMQQQRETLQGMYQGLEVTYEPVVAYDQNYVPPAPWQQHIDDHTGAPYYYNPETGVTQWIRP